MKTIPAILMLLTIMVLLAFIGIITEKASAKIITVDDGSGEDYTRVQDAINASEDGDTVLVNEGVYYENVVVNKTISLIGSGMENTTIDGGSIDDVVRIEADWVNVSGFSLTNSDYWKAGIMIESDNNTIKDTNCSNNRRYGIRIKSCENNTIMDNICRDNINYGISLAWGSNNLIQNNTCYDVDMGIMLFYSPNNTVIKNTCTNVSYGIRIDTGGENIISGNTCSFNVYTGLYMIQYCHNNTIAGNTFNNNGWRGAYIERSNNNLIDGNTLLHNDRGIRFYMCNHNIISNNTLRNNIVGLEFTRLSHNNSLRYNTIYNNSDYGINVTEQNHFTIHASYNFWGHSSGPYHPSNNSNGKGDNVSDDVEFMPWLKVPLDYVAPAPRIESVSPNPALVSETVVLVGAALDDRTIELYVWRIDSDEMYNGTETEFSLTNLSAGSHTVYLKVMDSYGIWGDEIHALLIIHQKPLASINSISPTPALDTDTIVFAGGGSDDGSIGRYLWISSLDGEIHNDTSAGFSTSDLSVGEHTMYLKAQDNQGAWSEEVSETLVVHTRPTAAITSLSPDSTVEKKAVRFTGSGVDDGSITRYVWQSSIDGEFYNDTNTSFEYPNLSAGSHTIYLTVLDDHGAWSEEVQATLLVKQDGNGNGNGGNGDGSGDGGGVGGDDDSADDDAGYIPAFELITVILGLLVTAIHLRKRQG